MNVFQQTLWNDLMHLVATKDAFFFVDQTNENRIFRIFNYRIASWTEFLMPNALNCRGTMFEIDEHGLPIRLASLPMHKFFNLGEGDVTPDLTKLKSVEVKADGSLISSYMIGTTLFLKSKGSLFSEQAINAMTWLNRPENITLKSLIFDITMDNYTVNMEWCSPDNRIVIGYEVPRLTVLNVRSNDGTYVSLENLPLFNPYLIETLAVTDPVKFVASIPDVKGIEGYVLKFEDGLWIKCKGTDYLHLHKCKDSVNNPRALFEAVVDETTDDLLALFKDDALAKAQIMEMQEKVGKIFNGVVNSVETFYANHKHLERKDYAIAGQKELDRMWFGLAMNKYLNKEVNYKETVKRHYKELGIKDSPKTVEE